MTTRPEVEAVNHSRGERNEFLDFAKGILILLVTIGHATQFLVHRNMDFWADPLFKAIYLFHMPLFAGISGYLARHGVEGGTFLSFIGKRARSYLIPIFVWAVAYKTITYILLQNEALKDLPYLIFRNALGSLWFLWVLFACLVVVSLARFVRFNFWISCTLLYLLTLALPEVLILVMFKMLFPFFLAGYALAAVPSQQIRSVENSIAFRVAALTVAVICFLVWKRENYVYESGMGVSLGNLPNVGMRLLAGASCSIVALLIMHWLQTRLGANLRRLLCLFGAGSILIYIPQDYLFYMLSRAVERFGFPETDILTGSLLAVAVGVIVAAGCYIFGRLVSRNDLLGAILFGRIRAAK